ncbi:cation-transporting P-type ATPase [Kineosporia sp. A_224]|uniref:cation-translocating P-type ATPase n=1 Tax=Kineosporia sp. A_224 TaxID=1962180 RepID=UPI000B4BC1AA|nr:cation-transporting P-type ATPase [Kineosporia sp. A_224]
MAASTDELTRTGLTSTEAARLLGEHGPNEVTVRRPVPLLTRVVTQLRDPLILVLLAAVVLTLVTGDYPDAIIIGFVVVANSTVGVAQELRAESAVAALAALAAPTARVHRDGQVRTVPAVDLVPGDVVDLTQGDIVPADAVLVESAALLVDEAALTGESVPVEKSAEGAQGTTAGTRVSAGTVVVRGRAVARVTATGAASATGRIASMLDTGPGRTPLQRRLAGLGRVLAGVAGALCVVVAALGLWRGQPLELMVVTAISLVVAAVPESLPAVVTLSLALGARRMAARGAIVRRLAAVETLGSVTVVATDKTGTLTEGQMVVERLWTPSGEARVTGLGYGPDGEVVLESGSGPFVDLLAAAALCNDAALEPPTGDAPHWTAVGDPTEAALLTAASKTGPDAVPAVDARGAARVAEAPFDSLRRRMSTLHRLPDGRYLLTCKGAPEVLLAGDRLDDPTGVTPSAVARAAAFADDGYRVLAVARKALAAAPPDLAAQENGLELLGLVAISDPPRPAAADAIAACRAAGISTVLITGDHAATASALAGRLGLLAPGEAVVTGDRLLPGPDGPGASPVGVHVFARTTPEQKLDIIQALRDDGQVVAMIGDGVNDAPALRRADIGVAMGGRGTEVARQAADLVLADDDLATVASAVEEGRRVYANVRRFLLYGLAGGTAEIVVMLVGPLLGMALPLLPAQILWVNLVTHGLPGVALGAEPVAEGTMTRAPRPPDQSVLGAGLWQRILQLATVVAATSLAVGWWAHAHDLPWQSMLFVALGATQLGSALGVRARPRSWQNPALLWATAAAFGLQVVAVYLPVLQTLLGTTALSAGQLAAVSATAGIGYVAARLQTALATRPPQVTAGTARPGR